MSFLKNLFGAKLDGAALAKSNVKEEYAQIGLLSEFARPRGLHSPADQQRWGRALPRPYADMIATLRRQGWLEQRGESYCVSDAGRPVVDLYQARLAEATARAKAKVRKALEERDAGEALEIRRTYEFSHPLGKADWTGPEPQLSRSSLTRRILFLQHWLLDGVSPETAEWLKLYAAEQHLWETYWRLDIAEIPAGVQNELALSELGAVEAAYWRAYQLALYVDNQETWQRCKGGDHVRRIEIAGPDDEYTCEHCRGFLGKEYLVARAPDLPHRGCTSARGCRCRYEPVLESVDDGGH